ncbi:MAG: hypothetical protein AAB547_00010 [Patescibacteria group bacterium]
MKNIRKTHKKHNRVRGHIPGWFEENIEAFLLSDSLSATTIKFLLMFIAMGGIAVVGATLPGLVKTIGAFTHGRRGRRNYKNKYSKKQISNTFEYLKKKQLIEVIKEENGRTVVRLTNKGKKRLMEYSIDMVEIKRPEKWDGKWRILMFDIPAYPKKYNCAREALRNKIKELGFYQIQKSVWAYPYECEDELLFIAETFKVQKYIEIITADRILHEKILRKKFLLL